MRSGPERNADDGEHARGGAEEAGELDGDLRGELEALRVHVVLDDDLQAKLRVPERRDQERDHQHGVPRLRDQRARRGVIEVQYFERDPDDPEPERDQRDGRDALDHEVVRARTRRAEPVRDLHRRAEPGAHAAPPRITTQAQMSAVSTKLPITTIQPARTNVATA